MATLAKQTGIAFHAHQFRHTFATNLVLQGMNPYHVMTLTRHRSVQNFRRYTKATDQQAAEAAFDAVVGTSRAIAAQPNTVVPMTHHSAPTGSLVVAAKADAAVPCAAVESPSSTTASTPFASAQSAAKQATVYQLKVVLGGIRPQIWRRSQVLGSTPLEQLHLILQTVMGWEDFHLHRFSLGEDESLRLEQPLLDEAFTFTYVYAFGDAWLHQIIVEKLLLPS